MRKRLIMWTALLLLLGLTELAAAAPSGTGNSKADFSGVYDITFTTKEGQQQSGPMMMEDLKNGQFELSGDFQGYPLRIEGELTGDVEQGGATGRFNINKFGMVKAQGEFTIRSVDNRYQLQGQLDGSYSYMGKNGQIVGTMTGSRREPITSPTPTPDSVPLPEQEAARSSIKTVAALAGLVILIAALAYGKRRKRAGV